MLYSNVRLDEMSVLKCYWVSVLIFYISKFVFCGTINSSNDQIFTEQEYKTALRLSLLFYEAQRSGKLPENNRINWRGDSGLDDRGQNGEDLTGGYYDAGDYVKFSFTMAFSTTILAWGMLAFDDGYRIAGQYSEALEAIKWATDYFLKCHVSPHEFYGQVGDFPIDHAFWGRPEDMNMSRPAYKIDREHPGSDLAGEASAALSSASILFNTANATYARELVKHAEGLFDFAVTHKGLYHEAIPGAKVYYESTGYSDELTWAAIWLYKATRDVKYIEQATGFYAKYRINDRPSEFSYNKKAAGIQLLLAQLTTRSEYTSAIGNFCNYSFYEQTRTPSGLLFIDKIGTLAHAANVAFLCLVAESSIKSDLGYAALAREQIDYMLGAKGRSFVVGFGRNYPKRPHHSASSCPDRPEPCGWKQYMSPGPNPQILYGALVSGPDLNDHYDDIREEFLYNEVTLDYNAGYQGALAGLIQYYFYNHSLNYHDYSSTELTNKE